jgi:GST-like protein
MLELYGAVTGNCLRAAIALEEAGQEYVVRRLDLRAREHRSEAMLRLNPAGKVPILVETRAAGEGSFVLTQSNAIALYVADKAPGRLLPSTPGAERAVALERFFYFITDVIAVNHAGFYLDGLGEHSAAALMHSRAIEAASAAERFLGAGRYMGGDRFTLADIAAYTILSSFGDKAPMAGRLRDWFDHVGQRPAVARGLQAFDRPSEQAA